MLTTAAQCIRALLQAHAPEAAQAQARNDDLYPATADLVDRFAAALHDKLLAIEKAELRQCAEQCEAELAAMPDADEWHALRERAERAEAELAALKARIAEAQECGVVALCGGGTSLSHEPYESLIGKRVRLVKVED